MNMMAYLQAWGPLALFVVVLAEQVGLPLPTLPIMLLAGALARQSGDWGSIYILAATAASFLGGSVWYLVGRRHGSGILRQLCRISLSPDTCVRQTQISFERQGARALIAARFIPGLSLLAPPLAGGIGMPVRLFAVHQAMAALLYAVLGIGGGVLFYRQLDGVLGWFSRHGWHAVMVSGVLLLIWLGYKFWVRRQFRLAIDVRRITVDDLALALATPQPPLVLDVRSAQVRALDLRRVASARPVDINDKSFALGLPLDSVVVTFCSCPNDASAIVMARRLMRDGHTSVFVLVGGLDSWSAKYGDQAGVLAPSA